MPVAISNHATLAAHSYVKPSKAVELAYWAKKSSGPWPPIHRKQYTATIPGGTTEQFMTRLAKKVGVWCKDCDRLYCDCVCSGVAHGDQ